MITSREVEIIEGRKKGKEKAARRILIKIYAIVDRIEIK